MKKKIIFATATGFFAVATMFNMNMVQSNSAGDISLESIAVMSQARGENGYGIHCKYIPRFGYCGYSSAPYSYRSGC